MYIVGNMESCEVFSLFNSFHSGILSQVTEWINSISSCTVPWLWFPGSTFNEEERERLERQVQIYEMIELIWSLCEMLFIEVSPGMCNSTLFFYICFYLRVVLGWHQVMGWTSSNEIKFGGYINCNFKYNSTASKTRATVMVW